MSRGTATWSPRSDETIVAIGGAPVQRREVVGRELERVEQVVDVLDVHDRPESPKGRADPLPQDRRLAYAGVDNALLAVLCLQSLEDEVDVAELSDVLAEDEDPRVALQVRVEAPQEHHPAVHHLGVAGIRRRDRADPEGRLHRTAVEVRVEKLV